MTALELKQNWWWKNRQALQKWKLLKTAFKGNCHYKSGSSFCNIQRNVSFQHFYRMILNYQANWIKFFLRDF